MQLIEQTLVTIVTESVLEKALVKEFDKLGVQGYTVSESHGKGESGTRIGDWEPNRNTTLQVVCDRAAAEKLLTILHDNYETDYAFFAYLAKVEVYQYDKPASD